MLTRATLRLTEKQINALQAVCDGFIPSIALEDQPTAPTHLIEQHSPENMRDFWLRSASDSGVAERIVEALAFVRPEEQNEFKQLLDLLASPLLGTTWFGPWRAVTDLSLEQRERLLQAWSRSRIGLLRKGFSVLKKLTTFLYYGYSDDTPTHRINPVWTSIGYPGPLSEPPARETIQRLPTQTAKNGDIFMCDVLVVGSGAGGGVVAGELAEAGAHVMVVEKGVYAAEDEFTQRETQMMAKLYEAGGTLTTRNGAVSVLAGSCLGGGTTVNWTASLRTPEHILEAWAHKHHLPHVLTAEYKRGFDAVEQATHIDTRESQHNAQNLALACGAAKLGWDTSVIPRNSDGCLVDQCKSCGYCCFGCQRGSKRSTLKTYLERAVACGAQIFPDTEAHRIIIERGLATGIHAIQRQTNTLTGNTHIAEFTIKAKIVVVAAGSIHTPALLLRSGLQHQHIGRHLNFHPTVAVAGRYSHTMNPWWGNMMTALSNQVANLDDGFGAKIETAPIHSGMLALALPWTSGKQHKHTMLHAPHIAGFIVLTRDRDGGRVHVDKRGKPMLDYNLSQYDLKHLLAGVAAAARLHLAAGAEETYFPHNSFPTFRADAGERALEAMLTDMPSWGWQANRFPLFTAHQMSSCRMGGVRATHPVSPEGETVEIRNLFVADASALPECSGVNPMLSTQALAYYTAQNIKSRLTAI